MKYQIWLNRDPKVGTFTEELTNEEQEAFEELGFELQLEFEADDKEAATQTFIDWCDDRSDQPNRVERLDLVGALTKELEKTK